MSDQVELVTDGDGFAVLGERTSVESFLVSIGSPKTSEIDLPRLSKVMAVGAIGVQAHAAKVAAAPLPDAARWVRLTEESARKIQDLGGLTPTKTPGVSHAMIGNVGASKSWVQLDRVPGQLPANPAMLAGAPALMAQLAMQQTMQEITDYLAVIDAKLDDVLRAQKNTVLAQVIGVGLQIDEAMTLRQHVGRVSDITWSKVQDATGAVAEAQAYALLQLDAIADKLEKKSTIADLMRAAREAEQKTQEWIAVLARCFQLLDGLAVLELDRVLESAPADITGHRLGLRAAREERLATIEATTVRLVSRIEAAADRANSRVLFNPRQSPAVVQASTGVTGSVNEFHQRLGIGAAHLPAESRRWSAAAADVGRLARAKGATAASAGRRLGAGTKSLASSASASVGSRFAEAGRRRQKRPDDTADTPGDEQAT